MTETTLSRVFKFKDNELPDPNPTFSNAQVMDFYANQYPELTNASSKETREENRILVELSVEYGQKG